MPQKPLVVEVTRGPAVESRHDVHAVLVNGKGEITASYGDPKHPTFPRSSIKALQAIALVETGAAASFGLSNAELALACASHGGEKRHILTAKKWLEKIGLDETALECGAHAPYSAPHTPATILANNCSGKHTGMVTLSLFMQENHKGYTKPDHPAQQKILSTVGEMCGVTITPHNCGIDGCSAPNPVMPLENLAKGFAAFMNPQGLSMARGAACRQLYQAMVENPGLVGGEGRLDTVLMEAAKGKIACKVGGEAVYACVIPEKDTAIAVKVQDGAIRAAYAALFALLEKHKLADDTVLDAIRSFCLPLQKNWRGLEVGIIRTDVA